MKKEYIKPEVLVEDIESESMVCNSQEWGQIVEGLSKKGTSSSFDFSDDDFSDDDEDGFFYKKYTVKW